MPTINQVNLEGTVYDIQDAASERIANKVTAISSSSTDTEYPSAKCVYDKINTLDGEKVDGQGVTKIMSISQADYDALATKDSQTVYIIV